MRNLAVIAALFAALPLAAQQPTPPPPTPAPAPQTQNPPPKPTLEKPDEAPADVPDANATKAAPKKAVPVKKPAVSADGGKVVEEIVARVNNEVITRSELQHSIATAEDDAKSDCENRCTPEQLNQLTEDRRKNALR